MCACFARELLVSLGIIIQMENRVLVIVGEGLYELIKHQVRLCGRGKRIVT